MFRKPPIKTYGKGKGQEVPTHQPQKWPGMKSRLWNDSTINTESDSDTLETTFDKLAKDVRLPLPPVEVSNTSLDISSDISFHHAAHENIKVYKGPISPVTNTGNKRLTRAVNKGIDVKRRKVSGSKAPTKSLRSLLNTSEETPQKTSVIRGQISKKKIRKKKNVHGKLKRQPVRRHRRILSSDNSLASERSENKTRSSKNKLTDENVQNVDQNIDENDQCRSQKELAVANRTIPLVNDTDNASFTVKSKKFARSNGASTSTNDEENHPGGLPDSGHDDQQVLIKVRTASIRNLKDRISHSKQKRRDTNNGTKVDENFVNTKDNSSVIHTPNLFPPLEPNDLGTDAARQYQIKPCYIALTKNFENTPCRMQGKDKSRIKTKSYIYNSCDDIFCSHVSNMTPNHKLEPFKVDDNQSNKHEELDKYPNVKRRLVNVKKHNMMEFLDHTAPHNSGTMLCSTPLHKYTALDESMQHMSPIIPPTNKLEVSAEHSMVNNKLMNHSDPEYSRAMKNHSPLIRIKQLNSLNTKDIENVQHAVESVIIENSLCSIKVESEQKPSELLLGDTQTINSDRSDSSKTQIVHDSLCNDFPNSIPVQRSRKLDNVTNKVKNKSKCSGFQPTPAGIITTRTGRQLDLNLTTNKQFQKCLTNVEVRLETLTIDVIEKFTSRHKSVKTRRNMIAFTKNQRKVDTSIPDGKTRAKSRSDFDITSTNVSSALADDNLPKHQTARDSKVHKLADSELCNSHSPSSKVVNKSSIASESDIIAETNMDMSWVSSDQKDDVANALSQQDIPENVVFSSNELHSSNGDGTINGSGLSYKSTANESDWSTLSNSTSENHNADSANRDVPEKNHVLENLVKKVSMAYKKLSESDCSNKSWKSTQDQSLELTNVLRRRANLYAKINTRSRRSHHLSLKSQTNTRVKKNGLSTSDNSSNKSWVSATDIEELDTSENIDDSSAISYGLTENSLVENEKHNLQPIVLLQKLKSPPGVVVNQTSANDLQLNEPRKTLDVPSKTLETTSSEPANKSSISLYNDQNAQHHSQDHGLQPVIMLHQFECPPTVTTHRRLAWKSNLSLMHDDQISDRVSMNTPHEISSIKHEIVENLENPANIIVENSPIRSSPADTLSIGTQNKYFVNDDDDDAGQLKMSKHSSLGRQSVFLKPGKQYLRSLSILNSINQGINLEDSQPSKGKNWRLSVQTVIEMQKGVIQSCLTANEDDKTTQTHCEPFRRSSIIRSGISSSKLRRLKSSSPSEFTRRMSVRVVLDNKKPDYVEDTSFLEAYGISTGKNSCNLSRQSTIKPPRRTLPRDVECDTLAIEKIDTRHIGTARDVVLQRCSQEDYLLFEECFPEEYLEHCRKIGEGVYGEVFLYDNGEEKSVVKIIPIEGSQIVNGETQKRFHEILSEIVIAKELHNLRYNEEHRTHGFVEVKSIKCIIGKYPDSLIELWQCYDNEKGSDNDCPSVFDENQLYIVLELSHGGQDLEAFVFDTAVQAHALFVQTALALAVAEQSLEFEHRDLHWGNVLITRTNERTVSYKLGNKEYSYPTKGVKVAIIDFTLSRMSYDGCCIFNDLELDPALFAAQGEYQFEIYRLMRDKVGHNWQNFEPYTNILWLHYMLDKMITALRYKRKSLKRHRDAILQLQELKDAILDYESTFDFVSNCKKITELQMDTTRD